MSKDNDFTLLQNKLDDHIERFNDHVKQEQERWDRVIRAQENNTKSIEELTNSISGLVSAWNAGTGAVKVLAALGSVLKWLSGFAVIGAIISYFSESSPF